MKKKITIVVPTYNVHENIPLVYKAVSDLFKTELEWYDYSILFIDNASTDASKTLIRHLADTDTHVQAIFNARNFGQGRSHFYGLTQAEGDCAVLLHADLQNPLSTIVEFVQKWEEGAKVVIGIKDNSMESPLLFFLRSCYYKMMKVVSNVEQIQHFSDFELLDRSFLDVLKSLHDPSPYLRGIISELGFKMERVHYSQNRREHGKTHANFRTLYDFAMNGITSYSKSILRVATITGGYITHQFCSRNRDALQKNHLLGFLPAGNCRARRRDVPSRFCSAAFPRLNRRVHTEHECADSGQTAGNRGGAAWI